MHLKTNKTRSQQQLAVKLRVEPAEHPGALHLGAPAAADSRRKDSAGRRALLVAGAASSACTTATGAPSAPSSCCSPTVGSTDHRLARPASGHADRRDSGFLVLPVRRTSLELPSGSADGGDRLRIAGSAQQLAAGRSDDHHRDAGATGKARIGTSPWTAWARFFWVSWWRSPISTLVFPDRARLRLRDGLAQEFLVLGSFFEAILEGFRGAPAENLSSCATMC